MMGGQCLCGAVKFTTRHMPDTFGVCYCDMCKRWSGGRWMGAYVALSDLTLTGEDAITVAKTSDWAERAFCSKCGSSLWYKITEGPYADGVSISVGMFDDTSQMRASVEYYTDRKTCAYDFPEDRAQLTEAEVLAMFAPSEEGDQDHDQV